MRYTATAPRANSTPLRTSGGPGRPADAGERDAGTSRDRNRSSANIWPGARSSFRPEPRSTAFKRRLHGFHNDRLKYSLHGTN
jgi:hypothetical protein